MRASSKIGAALAVAAALLFSTTNLLAEGGGAPNTKGRTHVWLPLPPSGPVEGNSYTNSTPLQTVAAYTGDTTGGPTFNRPNGGNPPTSVSTTATAVAFHTHNFTAPFSGLYDINSQSATAGYDNFTALYSPSFNPASPLGNVVQANDDRGSTSRSGFFQTLTAGQQGVLVTTGFNNLDFGQFNNTIVGSPSMRALPDNQAAGLTSVINVPDNFTIQSLDSVVVHGLQHTWVGDLVVTLTHNGVTVDLLDRIRRTDPALGGIAGFGDDSDLNGDYAFAPGGQDMEPIAAGLPDGGVIPPGTYAPFPNATPGASSPAIGTFADFAGMNAAGEWVLHISDRAAADTGLFNGFSLNLTAVPEPTSLTVLALGAIALRRRRK